MKTITLPFILVFLLCCLIVRAQSDYHAEKDSLLRFIPTLEGEERLDAYFHLMTSVYHYEESMDSVLMHFNAFIQEAQAQNDRKTEGMVYVNLLAAYCNRELRVVAIEQAPSILEFLQSNELWGYYYQAYSIYLEACFFERQYSKTIEKAQELYELAKKQENNHGISAAYYSMALVYNKTGRTREAEEYFKKCIGIQQRMQEKSPLLTQAYFFLFEMVSGEKRTEEAISLVEDWKRAIEAYETSNQVDNPIAKGQIYGAYAQLSLDQGELDKAEMYCDSVMMVCSDPISEANTLFLRGLILSARKEYSRALELLDKADEMFSSFHEWEVTIEIMKAKMEILLRHEHDKEALSLFNTLLARKDSLSDTGFHAQLDELRTRYEVDKHIADKEKVRYYMYFALAGCVSLIIILGIWIYYHRQIARKNKTLVSQLKKLRKQHGTAKPGLSDNKPFERENTEERPCSEKRKEQLCLTIRAILLKEKAYRDPSLTRDMLIERLGTNKELFIEAFRTCFGMSFPEYLNSLRLKDALSLLEESDLSIEEISEKAGFGSVRTFQRQFRTTYNMSPKEYRKAIEQ